MQKLVMKKKGAGLVGFRLLLIVVDVMDTPVSEMSSKRNNSGAFA